jgi:hypothetical protein
MKLCYFIMCHHKPEQFARLLAALHDPRDILLVHVSASASEPDRMRFQAIAAEYPNARILPPRRVVWAHWSLSDTYHAGLSSALEHPEWDYLIHLSGQCFPIKSKEHIRHFLSHPTRAERGPDVAPAGSLQTGRRLWPNYVSLASLDACPPEVRWRFRAFWVLVAGRMVPLPAWRRPPKGVDYRWKGDYWSTLHRDFCEWLLQDPLPSEILRFLRRSKNPDEFWLHWSIESGPFRGTRRPCLHFIRWAKNRSHPDILTTKDFSDLCASQALFARKFDVAVDEEIVSQLERKLRERPAAAGAAASEATIGGRSSGAGNGQ